MERLIDECRSRVESMWIKKGARQRNTKHDRWTTTSCQSRRYKAFLHIEPLAHFIPFNLSTEWSEHILTAPRIENAPLFLDSLPTLKLNSIFLFARWTWSGTTSCMLFYESHMSRELTQNMNYRRRFHQVFRRIVQKCWIPIQLI